jgi:hypothetical protein
LRTLLLCLCLCSFSVLLTPVAKGQAKPEAPTAPPPRTLPLPPPDTTTTPPKVIPPELLYDTSDGKTSVKLFYWYTQTHPDMFTGKSAATNVDSSVSFEGGKTKPTPGLELSFPAGKNNSIRISYFRTQGSGNTNAVTPPSTRGDVIWGATLNPGDYLATSFTLQSGKISLDYLSWPFPLENRRFRFKTLWEVQYVNVKSAVSAPFAPVTDTAGNSLQTSGSGSNWFIWPSFGVGVEIMASKHFRFEAKGSGFGLPHRAAIWDADAFFAYRSGQFEIDFGGKAFHFKTSPKREEYLIGTMPGAYVGIRWYPK